MLRRTRLLAKEFFKVPLFDTLLICVLVYLFYYGSDVYRAEYLQASQLQYATNAINFTAGFLAVCAYLGLALFMLLSYEFLHRCRTYSLAETMAATGRSGMTLRAQLFLLILLVLAFWAYICALCLRIMHATNTLASPLMGNLLLASVLYGFFPALIGVLLGAAGQKLVGRIGFYSFLALTVFFTSQMSRDVYFTLSGIAWEAAGDPAGIAAEKLMDYWFRLSPVYNSTVSTAYGIGIEPFHWALAAMWCLLGGGVLLATARGWVKRSGSIGCFVLALLCAVFVWHRGSNWNEYLGPFLERQVLRDSSYYQDREAVTAQAAAFHVTAYDMDLHCLAELSADVTVTLDNSGLDAYDFTLYHGFSVSQITDGDGNPVSFVRNGDYITVYREDLPISQLRFRYSGWHEELYSTVQGIYLPGYFCYYPMEGRRAVFDGAQLSFLEADLAPCDFSVRVHALCPVFTNLSAQGNDGFAGTATNLTVMGGFYQEQVVDDVRYVFPWGVEWSDMQGQLTELLTQINADWDLELPIPSYSAVFYSPHISLPVASTGRCTATEDALFVGFTYAGPDVNNMADAHLQRWLAQTVHDGPVRTWFLQILQGIINGDATGQNALKASFGSKLPEQWTPTEGAAEAENEMREVGYCIARAMETTSAKEVLQKIYAYLKTGDGDDLAFARSLVGGTNDA